MTDRGRSPAGPAQPGWLRMDWGDFRVAMPQPDIIRVSLPEEARPAEPDEDCAAWLPNVEGAEVPVYRLDDSMRPVRHSGSQGYIAVCAGQAGPFGLWCDGVHQFAPDQVPGEMALPPVFARRRPPLHGLHRDLDGAPMLITRAERLGQWLFAQSGRRRSTSRGAS